MSATTEKPGSKPQLTSSSHSVLEWLDSLTSGSCDVDTFSRAMTGLIRRTPDASWEVLSLLDQYYRRGRIKAEVFQTLKARFQSAAVGSSEAATRPAVVAAAPPILEPMAIEPVPVAAASETAITAPVWDPILPLAQAEAEAPPVTRVSRQKSVTAPALTEEAEREGNRFFTGDLLRDRYRLQRVLGQGANGIIFDALDEYAVDLAAPNQKLAIKVLHASVMQNSARFLDVCREFHELQSLSHPNIMRVHGFDRDGDTTFFMMELLSGSSISRLLRTREQVGLERAYAFTIIRRVGEAMLYARSRNVLQGSINPRSIFVTDDGEVRVLDFGTLQFDVAQPGALEDPYGLAVIAYLLLSGEHPYQNRSAVEARSFGLRARRPAGLTRQQWHALRSGLYFDRERRPKDIAAWLQQLDPRAQVDVLPRLAVLEHVAKRRRIGVLAYAGTALGLLVVAAGVWTALNYQTAGSALSEMGAGVQSAVSGASAFISEKLNGLRGHEATLSPPAADVITDSESPTAPAPDLAPTPSVAAPSAAAPSAATPSAAAPGGAAANAAASPPPAAPAARRAAPVAPALVAATVPAAPASSMAPSAAGGPPARIEFQSDTTEVAPQESTALVTVRRKGSSRNEATFSWWTESGTAKPGADFVAITPHVAQIEAGQDHVTLSIPLVPTSVRAQERNFYVVIDAPGSGATLGAKTLAMVSIGPKT